MRQGRVKGMGGRWKGWDSGSQNGGGGPQGKLGIDGRVLKVSNGSC